MLTFKSSLSLVLRNHALLESYNCFLVYVSENMFHNCLGNDFLNLSNFVLMTRTEIVNRINGLLNGLRNLSILFIFIR